VGTPPAVAPPEDQNPGWLAARLDQAKRTALAELGITDPEKAKKLLADAAKAEDEAKTQGQKLGETSKALEALQAENARQTEILKSHTATQMAALTPERQAAVRALAPDTDPAGQLRTIGVLAATWAATPPVAPPPVAPPVTPPGGTAPPPNAPPPNGTVSPPDRKAEYEALKAKNPHAAAVFLNTHADAIYPH
jgi:hypothetical protein